MDNKYFKHGKWFYRIDDHNNSEVHYLRINTETDFFDIFSINTNNFDEDIKKCEPLDENAFNAALVKAYESEYRPHWKYQPVVTP